MKPLTQDSCGCHTCSGDSVCLNLVKNEAWAIRDDETNALVGYCPEVNDWGWWREGYDRTLVFESEAGAESYIESAKLCGVTVVKLGLVVLDEGHSVEGFPDSKGENDEL